MSSFADNHTVALWLFDEPQYVNATLTDAGRNLFDLRLAEGGRLVPGRFGRALDIAPGRGKATAYAWAPKLYYPPVPPEDRPVIPPAALLDTLAHSDWTWEFWLKLRTIPANHAVIVDLGDADLSTFYLGLTSEAGSFILHDQLSGITRQCPTDSLVLADGNWHHIAFTCSSTERKVLHYLDGVLQKLPEYAAYEAEKHSGFISPQASGRFDLAIGTCRHGNSSLDGLIDEMHVSDVVRYDEEFTVPGSFSRNYGACPPEPAKPGALPLLFVGHEDYGVLPVGSRKHLFIDDAIIERQENLSFTANPPDKYQSVDFRMDQDWEQGSDTKPPHPGDVTVYDHDGKIRLVYINGAQWVDWSDSGRAPAMCVQVSYDGLVFEKPNLGLFEWNGSKENNIISLEPIQGNVFEDRNPTTPPAERFKMVGYCMQRGIYLYTSADGLNWRRNETIMLPFDCGGGVEPFWDDQQGIYACYIRNEARFPGDIQGRSASLAQTREPTKPWPFQPIENPPIRDVFTLPSLSRELPVPFVPKETGDVYRTRATKYEWAPDVYLGFVWRHTGTHPDDYREVELVTSRDGANWKFWGTPYYIPAGWEFEGVKLGEALATKGLVRRGDEIWQYAMLKAGRHYDSSAQDRLVRVIQRLDGFVSVDAAQDTGMLITRPLIFDGDRLVINAAVKGELRVGLLDETGKEITGFGADECDIVHTDSVHHTVTWNGNADVSRLAGRPVNLLFRMQDAKLYAFQFIDDSQG